MKKLLFLLLLFCSLNCTKETTDPQIVTNPADTATELDLSPAAFITPAQTSTCIPWVPEQIDTAATWLGSSEIFPGFNPSGRARATVGTYLWEAAARASRYDDKIFILLNTYHSPENDYYTVEQMGFVIAPNATGCTELTATHSNTINTEQSYASYAIVDYDVTLNSYRLDTEGVNLLEITQIDTVQRIITGKFTLSLVTEDRIPAHINWPDRIDFVNGVFECDTL